MWCQNKKLDVKMYYHAESGSFGLLGKQAWDDFKDLRVLEWYSCREDFHNDTHPVFSHHLNDNKLDLSRFLFVLDRPMKAQRVAAFIGKFEGLLESKPCSSFGPTPKSDVIWCRPAAWWRKSHARRSLFTGLIRTSLYYDPARDNFNDALNYRTYTRRTRKAIDYFIKGHTTFRGNTFDGWQSTFEYRSDAEIQRMLVKPGVKVHVAGK
jgi:hypothetical protein